MTVAYKVLGQQAPGATTSTTLYTVPASTETVLSYVSVCNRGTVATTFRLGVDVNGAGDSNPDYVHYDTPIEAGETIFTMHGTTMDATDLLRCYAGNANLTFSAFGQENS
jgi:hypothetical protein